MSDEGIAELVSVLLTMGVLLLIAIIVVVIFFRTWRKENKDKRRSFFD